MEAVGQRYARTNMLAEIIVFLGLFDLSAQNMIVVESRIVFSAKRRMPHISKRNHARPLFSVATSLAL